MCVYHSQPEMYDHLVEFCGSNENMCNNRGLTPLLLAASLGKLQMFQHIYNKKRKAAWAYGPVSTVICMVAWRMVAWGMGQQGGVGIWAGEHSKARWCAW